MGPGFRHFSLNSGAPASGRRASGDEHTAAKPAGESVIDSGLEGRGAGSICAWFVDQPAGRLWAVEGRPTVTNNDQ